MICVKMDHSFRDIQKAHDRNIFWMCDGCAEMFTSDHFRKLTSCCSFENIPDAAAIKSLKDDIAELKDTVRTLTSKVDVKPITPLMTNPWSGPSRMPSNPIRNTPKRVREASPVKEKPSAIRGTRAASVLVKTVSPPEEMFWLYLSAFDPSTSDGEISSFVKKCMDLTGDVEPKVSRLVPKDKDPATLSFVTFKVGLNKSLKDAALSKETWPENIFFREFDIHSKNQRSIFRVLDEKSPLYGQ